MALPQIPECSVERGADGTYLITHNRSGKTATAHTAEQLVTQGVILRTATSLLVPYIASYSEEAVSLEVALVPHSGATRHQRLSYVDSPRPDDWMFGVLWARQEDHRRGRPQYDQIHTARQRRCMLDSLCQVCAGTAIHQGRTWWVLPTPAHSTSLQLSKAPTCRSCIPAAIDACPRLRSTAHVYTSAGTEPYGVVAHLAPKQPGRRLTPPTEVPLDSFQRLEQALARALIVQVWDLQPATP